MKSVVLGAQWGDEGKGKIVDYLAESADIVIRYSGGANAGHTIVTGDTTYKLHLVPSGIIYPDKIVILGTAMVVDPEALFTELQVISDQGISWQGRIFISDRAHLVLPEYKHEDTSEESSRHKPLGTTGRGIGSTYAHKAKRDGIRLADIFDTERYALLTEGQKTFLEAYREKLRPMLLDLVSFMADHKDSTILFEGAQGTLLDIDLGTYPYVSSGISAAAGACVGGGVGPRDLDRIYGVFKAYSTRVGNGPFPSEFHKERDGDLEEVIRETGREYGVTTGRPRRCGYLDLPALKYACQANSIDTLVLTHLDVYDAFDTIQVCTAYRRGEKVFDNFPASIETLERAEPVLEAFSGWKTSLAGIRNYDDLPEAAKQYIRYIEEYTGTSIGIISVGYRREDTITR
ncbi:MAG: adenylosuccinate synthase [Spirochaetales bacterium]|nr:adenylosuccinate synthase [Spirochaetales bacterium]